MGKASKGMAADKQLAMAALEKQRRGEQPTREEAAALRRFEKELEDQRREECYRAVPKKLWHIWSGRQHKVILEQADRYEFPMLRGASIDLPAFVKRLHDWWAEVGPILAWAKNRHPSQEGTDSPRERKLELEIEALEFKLQCEKGQWIERRLVHEGHSLVGSILRSCGGALHRQFGESAKKILDDALDNCEREIDHLLAIDVDNADLQQRGSG
jgi:hypothetical protein